MPMIPTPIPAPFNTPLAREYVDAVARRINAIDGNDIAHYMTTICTECDALGMKRPDNHCLIGNIVLIGCEGYFLINPANVLDNYEGEWYDWVKGY